MRRAPSPDVLPGRVFGAHGAGLPEVRQDPAEAQSCWCSPTGAPAGPQQDPSGPGGAGPALAPEWLGSAGPCSSRRLPPGSLVVSTPGWQ